MIFKQSQNKEKNKKYKKVVIIMMSLKEFAVDVDKSIEEIISLCKKLNISSQTEDDMLTEEDIILLDNEISSSSIDNSKEEVEEVEENFEEEIVG